MSNKKYILSIAMMLSMIAGLALAMPALAQTGKQGLNNSEHKFGNSQMHAPHPGIFGKVTAISGNTLIVTVNKMGPKRPIGSTATTTTSTVYNVDATSATVTKNNVASTVSSIAVGDTVMIEGTVSGTNVTAKTIRDGAIGRLNQSGVNPTENQGDINFQGNGQPIVAGNVTVINGSSITVTNKSNVTYIIDASNAKILKGDTPTPTIANVVVGDNILAQGTVNGTSIVASSIIDQGVVKNVNVNANNTQVSRKGFFASIGNFFAKIFGF